MLEKSIHFSKNPAELELTEAELDSLMDEELLTSEDELLVSSEELSGSVEELLSIPAEELSITDEDEGTVSTGVKSLDDFASGILLDAPSWQEALTGSQEQSLSQAAKKTRVERLRIAKTDFMLFLLVIFRYTIPHPVSGPGICLREYGRRE